MNDQIQIQKLCSFAQQHYCFVYRDYHNWGHAIQVADTAKMLTGFEYDDIDAIQLLGMIKVLEMVLHQTGNYRGFRFLMLDEVPDNHLPGIVVHGTIEDTPPEIRFKEGCVDKTRVEYF